MQNPYTPYFEANEKLKQKLLIGEKLTPEDFTLLDQQFFFSDDREQAEASLANILSKNQTGQLLDDSEKDHIRDLFSRISEGIRISYDSELAAGPLDKMYL